MRVAVYETVSESFELEVPAEVLAQGDDAVAKWIEEERCNGNHPRRFDTVLECHWEKVA